MCPTVFALDFRLNCSLDTFHLWKPRTIACGPSSGNVGLRCLTAPSTGGLIWYSAVTWTRTVGGCLVSFGALAEFPGWTATGSGAPRKFQRDPGFGPRSSGTLQLAWRTNHGGAPITPLGRCVGSSAHAWVGPLRVSTTTRLRLRTTPRTRSLGFSRWEPLGTWWWPTVCWPRGTLCFGRHSFRHNPKQSRPWDFPHSPFGTPKWIQKRPHWRGVTWPTWPGPLPTCPQELLAPPLEHTAL